MGSGVLEMGKTFKLQVVTPERQVLAVDAESAVLPGAKGSFGVLAEHAPMLAALKPGVVKVTHGGKTDLYSCGGGYAEVTGDKLIVLADSLEAPSDIDSERAKKALKRAEERLSGRPPGTDVDRAMAALDRARARLAVLEAQLAGSQK
jgi:F-type H+-transporting ATPase subunit epsilon